MRRLYCIAVLLVITLPAIAQSSGNVTVHADPRLSVSFKKNSTASKLKKTQAENENEANERSTPIASREKSVVAENTRPVPAQTASMNTAIPKSEIKRPLGKAHANNGSVVYVGKGFRVQIYYGSDRNEATKIRNEFIRQHPSVKTYLTYTSPTFRVRIGDFRDRGTAQEMLKEANKINKPSMIVPDDISVTAL
jgi:SPOR domain